MAKIVLTDAMKKCLETVKSIVGKHPYATGATVATYVSFNLADWAHLKRVEELKEKHKQARRAEVEDICRACNSLMRDRDIDAYYDMECDDGENVIKISLVDLTKKKEVAE